MYYQLTGELVLAELGTAVIDCAGVGYKLTVSGNTFSKLAAHVGEKVRLYTYLAVREDALELYGFYTSEEHKAFCMLITVSGVGPKAAISILSVLDPGKFAHAVASGDAKALAAAQGIGGKTAARIVLELKDKIAKELAVSDEGGDDAPIASINAGSVEAEARDALAVLGYTRSDASKAIAMLNTEGMSLEEVIRAALAKLMKQ